MFKLGLSKDMKNNFFNNDKRRIPPYLLALCLTLIVMELKMSVKQGTVVTTLNTIKHY